ncbi:MAG: antibiotic biosynthesis monooxygenase [Anaerolineae bacterium]|nr:antibiotic biosynthesis monooxygenase [Anaerolineae bacterium]
MIEIVREFVVHEEARHRFELAFGPGGAWSQLFGRAAGFRGITLLRDVNERRRYLMIEVWDSEAHRRRALAEQGAEHARLEADLAAMVTSRIELGAFTMLAAAAVRPARGALRR